MGLGKTVITLTAIWELMYEDFEIRKVLVVAPAMIVDNVWQDEGAKWDHLNHLKIVAIKGTSTQRMNIINSDADIYVISRDNIAWLVGLFATNFPFDMLVLDELSSFKSHDSKRFKALKIIRPLCKRVVGLTGTPTGNGLVDLWPEMYLIDMGKRLGRNISYYREHYLTPTITRGHTVYKYEVNEPAQKAIHDAIKDICISMSNKDYGELPDKIEINKFIDLPNITQQRYDAFEKEQVLEIIAKQFEEDNTLEISALNAAALSSKLLQFANGAVYDSEKNYHVVHDLKLEVLEEIIEAANGEPILIFYTFKHDLKRIQKKFKAVLFEGKKQLELWNKKQIPLMIAHPASAGHGLNLQAGGSIIVYFSLPWSLELYLQSMARLYRQGQLKPVVIYKLIARKTLDTSVVKALARKQKGQDALMEAVKLLIDKYA